MAQFPKVNTSRGAPMGRRDDPALSVDVPRSIRLFRVNLDRGGYDDGGAYWGIGRALFCAIDDDDSQQFCRGGSRERAALCMGIPNTALKRPLFRNGLEYGMAVLDGRAPMPEGETLETVAQWMRDSGKYFDGTPA